LININRYTYGIQAYKKEGKRIGVLGCYKKLKIERNKLKE
jgi:hypothetical protein